MPPTSEWQRYLEEKVLAAYGVPPGMVGLAAVGLGPDRCVFCGEHPIANIIYLGPVCGWWLMRADHHPRELLRRLLWARLGQLLR